MSLFHSEVDVANWTGLDLPPPQELIDGLAHNAGVARPWLQFSKALMTEGALPEVWRELVILRVGSVRGSSYVVDAHRRIGTQLGLREEQVRWAVEGLPGDHAGSVEASLLRAADELISGGVLSRETQAALCAHLDPPLLLELAMLVGQYLTVAALTELLGLNG